MDLIEGYLAWLQHNKGRAERTVTKYRRYLEQLAAWLQEEQGASLLAATREQLEVYTGLHAHQELQLRPRARRPLVAAVKGFYQWAASSGHIPRSPAAALEYPKIGERLPRAMSLSHLELLMMQPDLSTFVGVRDAAMLGVIAGCGVRISSAVALDEEDLLWHEADERLVIRFPGKGGKENLVPAPPETTMLLHAYLGHPELMEVDRTLEDGRHVLFVSDRNRMVPPHKYHGEARRLGERGFFKRMRQYGEAAGIPEDELHPHALRHLFGTEMVEHDVNLLVHQALMGHADPKTTQGYSRLALRKKTAAVDRASPLRNINTPVSALVRELEAKRRKGAS